MNIIASAMKRGNSYRLRAVLGWSDVDFDNYIIDTNISSLYVNNKGTFEDTTKNFSSKRIIKIPVAAIHLLREHKAAQGVERFRFGDAWQESDKLFTQCNGKPIHPDSVTSWYLNGTYGRLKSV